MSARPRALDLFCAGGGSSAGLVRAGFDVVGVDLKVQPRYPFPFVQADALEYLDKITTSGEIDRYALVTASPPCFVNSVLRTLSQAERAGHVDLIPETRVLLQVTGLPYVLENVPGADMRVDLELCGSMFGLGARCRDGVYRQLVRHRWFESNRPMIAPGPCRHEGQAIGVHGSGPRLTARGPRAVEGRGGYQGTASEKAEAMGISWLPYRSLNLAIPPAYTEWIGRQLLAQF